MNFSALVSSMVTVSRSPMVSDGPRKATQPAQYSAATSSTSTVRNDSAVRQAMRRILRLRRSFALRARAAGSDFFCTAIFAASSRMILCLLYLFDRKCATISS